MRQIISKSPILVLVIVAGLAAGTALVAGYVDRPDQGAAVTADSKCAGCPNEGTGACCKVSGSCEKTEGCVTPCKPGSYEPQAAAGCCQEKAQAACCPGSGGEVQAVSPCGAGGCAQTE